MGSIGKKIHLKLCLMMAVAMLALASLILGLVTVASQNMIDERVYQQEMPAQLQEVRNALEAELSVPVTLSKSALFIV